MKREIPGIDALAKAFPAEWLLYASLNCYPRAQPPMEIDALVVMDDRVLVLEIKDWNGKLTQNGDRWFVGGQSRGRSAVILVQEKAKKLKSVLRNEIPNLRQLWVDARVILTASATRDHIANNEKEYVWTLAEACSISDSQRRSRLLARTKLGLLKAYKFEQDFDRVTNNPKLFQPLEADWAGYRVSEANVVVHRHDVWKEHRAERKGEARLKALLRIWSFDRLPPGLNSPDRRRMVAEREMKAFAHLTALGSTLIERNALLRDIGPSPEEILTNHFELRALSPDWTTWDRFIERSGDRFDSSDRVALATTLLANVAELHKSAVAHRDLGPRSVWVGSPTKMAFSGLMCCQLPEEESVADWLSTLKGYALDLPEDQQNVKKSTGTQRDVFLTGRLVAAALGVEPEALRDSVSIPVLPPDFQHVQEWINKSLAAEPERRFQSAVEMAEEFAALTESFGATVIDQALIDRHETSIIPYVTWPPKSFFVQDARRSVYLSDGSDGKEAVVKVWNGLRRNVDAATDLALLRLLESASRILAAPVAGLPKFLEVGLSPVGPYVIYRHENGRPLDTLGPLSVRDTLVVAAKLLSAVMDLHNLGCEHGDIAAKNILFDSTTIDICILDAFDISSVGDGTVRTPALCPDNWEQLTQHCLDRYAALRVVLQLLETCNDSALDTAIVGIKDELTRPIIETLEVPLTLLRQLSDSLAKPPVPTFSLQHPDTSEAFFRPDGDSYFLTRRAGPRNSVSYSLTGTDRELVFSVQDGVLTSSHFNKTAFGVLSFASRNGVRIPVNVSVSRGAQSGFSALFEFIKTHAELFTDLAPEEKAASAALVDVRRHWDRLIDLEARDRLEVEIIEEVAFSDGVTVYTFQSSGRVLDFDPESSIDVYLPPNKRVGELEHGFSPATNTLAIRSATRRLSAGDSIFLVDRREQTSIDRRTKAVRKILDDQAAIPRLIEYFAPEKQVEPITYDLAIGDEALKGYQLNYGQEDAFRHLLCHGPIGLLQGPPGTGKTRFIASFVHWLMTEAGARRILITSQSHEAVNNAIEALVDLYRSRRGKPNLLRIGSKGITEKIRPYHSSELRDRYRIRFEAAMKHRVTVLGMEKGVRRQLTADIFLIDQRMGAAARLCQRLRQLAAETSEPTAAERTRYEAELRRAEKALKTSGAQIVGMDVDVNKPMEELERAYRVLLIKHPQSSEADLTVIRQIIELAREWINSMASIYRNFDEFLAKTRGIITATCVGVGETKIRIDTSQFDWVIVDEAARCTSSELAVPIQMGRRVLLVGDHLQLMPMIKRNLVDALEEEFPHIARDDLTRSDFERAFLSHYGKRIGRQLTEQYRMHPQICELVSSCFYEPNSVTLTTSGERRSGLQVPANAPAILAKPICWVDTAAASNSQEIQLPNSTTFHNDAEIEAIIKVLDSIATQDSVVEQLFQDDNETPIGIICMYSGQKRRLEIACARHAWTPRFRKLIRIDTVDAYQGKENAIVIVSLVRSNPARIPGHVRSDNRCNVAMSRAKERLIVVGSSTMWNTVSEGSPMRRAFRYIQAHTNAASIVPMEVL